jgi:hypothetical protein
MKRTILTLMALASLTIACRADPPKLIEFIAMPASATNMSTGSGTGYYPVDYAVYDDGTVWVSTIDSYGQPRAWKKINLPQ